MASESAHARTTPARHELKRRADSGREPHAEAAVDVLDARRRGPAARFAALLDGRHPVTVFAAAAILGYVALAAAMVGLGLLLTSVVLKIHGIADADERPVAWLAARRTPFRTDVSLVGSWIGAYVLVGLVVVLAVTLAVRRHWRIAAFVAVSLIVESASYRATTFFVHRHRPQVPRLENLPVDASFPSGHAAAAVAVYGGLALLITSRVGNTALRVACWAVAALLPVFVAVSRSYRGMHHPLDDAAGALMGTAALLLVLFAARAAGAAERRRRRGT